MRTLALLFAAGWLTAQPAFAQPREGDRPARDRDPLGRLLEAFDADEDGALSVEEIQSARDARGQRSDRPDRARERDPRGPRDNAGPVRRGPELRDDDGRRGPPGARDGDGRSRRDGARRAREGQGPADDRRGDDLDRPRGDRFGDARPFERQRVRPERLFARADANGDRQLSLDEFTGLLRRLPGPGARGPDGPRFGRFGGPGDDGPPRGEGRRARSEGRFGTTDQRGERRDNDDRRDDDREDDD